jgi:hypothetical protein
MLNSIQLRYLLIIIGLLIATTSGYFSVIGLSSIFGNSLFIILMSSLLEISKIVSVSFISSIYFKELNKILKYYIIVVTTILMIITSFGVYGYLSSNYQHIDNSLNESKLKLEQVNYVINENQKNLDYLKHTNLKLQKNIDDINKINDRTNLSALSYISDKNYNKMLKSLNKNSELTLNQIKTINNEINENNFKIKNINDTLVLYNNNKNQINLILNSNTDISTLKFISSVLNFEYNYIVNILILIIVFSFDPLAISLLISANYIKEDLKTKDIILNIENNNNNNNTKLKDTDINKEEEIKEEIIENNVVEVETPIKDVYNEYIKDPNKLRGELNDYNFIN